jgi:CheY-like chemotaxis protein
MPRIRALLPNIVAMVCSGYSEDALMLQYAEHGFDAILPKPYPLEQFATELRSARRTLPIATRHR